MTARSKQIARTAQLTHRYGKVVAARGIDLKIPESRLVAFIGPDGVGKSTLLGLLAGARRIQTGKVEVLGGNMRDRGHRRRICPRIAYMPQGLGRNLYMALSVFENVDFFGRLFGQGREEREWRINELLASTGLAPFADRPAGKLSGGMKQKLGLCCALIHDPDLLILDEPTTGVDPLSRRQFWELIDRIRARRGGMSVLVATAYMSEAEGFDWLVAMDSGEILATGSPAEIMASTATDNLDAAFIQLLPEEKRAAHNELIVPPLGPAGNGVPAIEARGLTRRFGDFTAVDKVSFQIERGEIFGFLGSNGCGKTTTMKMLTGLLPASEGEAALFGHAVDAHDIETRKRVGYMSQSFSLYSELTVRQNLVLHARLFHLPKERIPVRVNEMLERFDLREYAEDLAKELPLGIRQRLSLAVSVIHEPEILILDEPTSGVDPVARDGFWEFLVDFSRKEGVTIFVSTHFMNEAERCDRIALMHAGRVLATDSPANLVRAAGANNLEEAFISRLEEAEAKQCSTLSVDDKVEPAKRVVPDVTDLSPIRSFDPRRLFGYARRETLEVSRDPIRLAFALGGTVLLMFIIGYGLSLDVEDLSFAVLDRDQTPESVDYIQNISGSRYFVEHTPIRGDGELEERMRSGELKLAIEIPPDFGKDLKRGRTTQIGVWVDGAMPYRGETIRGYIEGMHYQYLRALARRTLGVAPSLGAAEVEVRYRYNQDFKSLNAMVPAVIPLLLVFIPAILTALAVVREKELGSITNLYTTPVSRLEFVLGKQTPYIAIGMLNLFGMIALAVTVFDVPLKGSFATLAAAGLLYVTATTGIGMLMSAFTNTQIAALAGTAILTLSVAVNFSGLTTPVSSLEGAGAFVGKGFPTTYYLIISRGAFGKGLGLADLAPYLVPLAVFIPVLTALSVTFIRRQGR